MTIGLKCPTSVGEEEHLVSSNPLFSPLFETGFEDTDQLDGDSLGMQAGSKKRL